MQISRSLTLSSFRHRIAFDYDPEIESSSACRATILIGNTRMKDAGYIVTLWNLKCRGQSSRTADDGDECSSHPRKDTRGYNVLHFTE